MATVTSWDRFQAQPIWEMSVSTPTTFEIGAIGAHGRTQGGKQQRRDERSTSCQAGPASHFDVPPGNDPHPLGHLAWNVHHIYPLTPGAQLFTALPPLLKAGDLEIQRRATATRTAKVAPFATSP